MTSHKKRVEWTDVDKVELREYENDVVEITITRGDGVRETFNLPTEASDYPRWYRHTESKALIWLFLHPGARGKVLFESGRSYSSIYRDEAEFLASTEPYARLKIEYVPSWAREQ